ncbi:STAS domain-containing protein [Streptomyces sp. NPDC005386]|uniref:STAS domain-containing protein n=1 Tax=unclassified Streptomyces TaxID=2593676 RepID=UPI0033B6E6A1
MLHPHGDLDHAKNGPFAGELHHASAAHPVVIVDLTHVTFGDSTLLNALIHAHQTTDLRLANIPAVITNVLTVTGLDDVLALYPDAATARHGGAPHSEAV